MSLFKKYKEMVKRINEAPEINTYHTKKRMRNLADTNIEKINQSHSTSTNEGNGIHSNEIENKHFYYYHDGKNPVEMIGVDEGKFQRFAHKQHGTQENIHKLMNHFINKNKELKSDQQQTDGSRKMWEDFVRNHPEHNYYAHNVKTLTDDKIHDIDSDNNKLWKSKDQFHKNLHRSYDDIVIRAEKKK